jgi:hypothetical protein
VKRHIIRRITCDRALGPVRGKRVSQIVMDETPVINLSPLNIDRFG